MSGHNKSFFQLMQRIGSGEVSAPEIRRHAQRVRAFGMPELADHMERQAVIAEINMVKAGAE